MGSSLLQLVTQVTAELGLASPATVVGNPSQEVIQLLALMNASGYELLRKADWRQLTSRYTFFTSFATTTGTVASGSQIITGKHLHQCMADQTLRAEGWRMIQGAKRLARRLHIDARTLPTL